MAPTSSCHFADDNARSLTLRTAPTPYSTIALRSFAGLIRRSPSRPSATIPISSCVICPTFSFSVSCATRSRTRCASADFSAGGGPSCCWRNVWLSTVEGACANSARQASERQKTEAGRRKMKTRRLILSVFRFPSSVFRLSEEDLQPELRLARVPGLRRLAERPARREGHDLRLRRIERHRGQAHVVVQALAQEVRPVEHVEDLEPELHL